MKFSDIKSAIARSESHDEIATVEVADKAAAYAALSEAKAAAKAASLDYGSTDSNEGWECWASAEDAADGDMVWRLDIRVTA